MTKRLRISHVVVQPVLVWDDGEEMTPAPDLNAVALPLSAVADFVEKVPGQVADLEAQLLAAEATPNRAARRANGAKKKAASAP